MNYDDNIQIKQEVTINVSNIRVDYELHRLLRDSLEFPEFYGMNWDAFWDSITGLTPLPMKLIFIGWDELRKALPKDSQILKELLFAYNKESYVVKREYVFS